MIFVRYILNICLRYDTYEQLTTHTHTHTYSYTSAAQNKTSLLLLLPLFGSDISHFCLDVLWYLKVYSRPWNTVVSKCFILLIPVYGVLKSSSFSLTAIRLQLVCWLHCYKQTTEMHKNMFRLERKGWGVETFSQFCTNGFGKEARGLSERIEQTKKKCEKLTRSNSDNRKEKRSHVVVHWKTIYK